MNQEKIGKFISTMRKKKDLTQEQLAEKLNVRNLVLYHTEDKLLFNYFNVLH